jgi:hypothetical protein
MISEVGMQSIIAAVPIRNSKWWTSASGYMRGDLGSGWMTDLYLEDSLSGRSVLSERS